MIHNEVAIAYLPITVQNNVIITARPTVDNTLLVLSAVPEI
jgi:hypothetical protein